MSNTLLVTTTFPSGSLSLSQSIENIKTKVSVRQADTRNKANACLELLYRDVHEEKIPFLNVKDFLAYSKEFQFIAEFKEKHLDDFTELISLQERAENYILLANNNEISLEEGKDIFFLLYNKLDFFAKRLSEAIKELRSSYRLNLNYENKLSNLNEGLKPNDVSVPLRNDGKIVHQKLSELFGGFEGNILSELIQHSDISTQIQNTNIDHQALEKLIHMLEHNFNIVTYYADSIADLIPPLSAERLVTAKARYCRYLDELAVASQSFTAVEQCKELEYKIEGQKEILELHELLNEYQTLTQIESAKQRSDFLERIADEQAKTISALKQQLNHARSEASSAILKANEAAVKAQETIGKVETTVETVREADSSAKNALKVSKKGAIIGTGLGIFGLLFGPQVGKGLSWLKNKALSLIQVSNSPTTKGSNLNNASLQGLTSSLERLTVSTSHY